MAGLVKYMFGTEAQILALTSESPYWIERGFYYPSDKSYFYQLLNGVMKKYGDASDIDLTVTGVGCTINDKVIGGIKIYIEKTDILKIPLYYDYNTYRMKVDGVIICDGKLNITL